MKPSLTLLLPCLFFCSTTNCREMGITAFYNATREPVYGPLIVRAGPINIHQSEVAYARSNGTTLLAEDIARLPENARRLVLTQLILRRLATEKGLQEGIFNTPEAERFIRPRLEIILEEYFLLQATGEESWQLKSQIEGVKKDGHALQTFAQQNLPQLNEREFQNAVNQTVDRMMAAKRLRERSRVQAELLKENPVEILP